MNSKGIEAKLGRGSGSGSSCSGDVDVSESMTISEPRTFISYLAVQEQGELQLKSFKGSLVSF